MWERVRPGEKVAGKYEVEQVLGAGATGLVVAAYHRRLQRRVAIKLLRETASSAAKSRIAFEARVAAQLRTTHIPAVYDVDDLPDGTPYIVMEYLEGRSLAEELAARGALPPSEAVQLATQACRALAEAHECGLVHRDVKPGNLFLVSGVPITERLRVLDFGVSRPLDKEAWYQAPSTHEGVLVGTPAYMSPEQIESSGEVDARVDVWGIGVVLYEMLAGRPPFVASTMEELCAKILCAQPASLCRHLPQGWNSLVALVVRCLEKRPEDRYGSMAELHAALEAVRFAPATDGLRTETQWETAEATLPAASTAPSSFSRRGRLALAAVLAITPLPILLATVGRPLAHTEESSVPTTEPSAIEPVVVPLQERAVGEPACNRTPEAPTLLSARHPQPPPPARRTRADGVGSAPARRAVPLPQNNPTAKVTPRGGVHIEIER